MLNIARPAHRSRTHVSAHTTERAAHSTPTVRGCSDGQHNSCVCEQHSGARHTRQDSERVEEISAHTEHQQPHAHTEDSKPLA